MTRTKDGRYSFTIPDRIQNKIDIEDTVWLSLAVLNTDFLFVCHTTKTHAPEHAHPISVIRSSGARPPYIHLLKQVCEAVNLKGKYVAWGCEPRVMLGRIPMN